MALQNCCICLCGGDEPAPGVESDQGIQKCVMMVESISLTAESLMVDVACTGWTHILHVSKDFLLSSLKVKFIGVNYVSPPLLRC